MFITRIVARPIHTCVKKVNNPRRCPNPYANATLVSIAQLKVNRNDLRPYHVFLTCSMASFNLICFAKSLATACSFV